MRTNNSMGAAGTCWNCVILPVKVLNAGGSKTLSDMIDGIMFVRNYALSNPSKEIIINLSLGRICSSGVTQAEQDAIDLAWASGILIVAAAGNDGDSQLQCSAMADHVIAVSVTTEDDERASFSSYGSFVIWRPGSANSQYQRRLILRILVRNFVLISYSERYCSARLVGRSGTF